LKVIKDFDEGWERKKVLPVVSGISCEYKNKSSNIGLPVLILFGIHKLMEEA